LSALDSDTLIATALKKLGNETITTDAEIWIFNILDRLYEDFKWPFLEKLATGNLIASQSSVTLPTDFDEPWDVDSFLVIDSSGAYHSLDFATQYDQDLFVNPSLTGTPQTALINLQAMTWRPYPLPDTSYSYQIRYKYKPATDAYTGTYANFTPVFPNDQILIQAIYVEGLQHEDDDRYVPEMQILQQMIARYKGKFNRQPNKRQKVRFSSRFGNPQSFR
jgi:hypothetical protein